MSEIFCKKCLFSMKLKGETHISTYSDEEVFHIDNSHKSNRKNFFLDFDGNIICPNQMNQILKMSKKLNGNSVFFNKVIMLVIFKNNAVEQQNLQKGHYLNLSSDSDCCFLKVIFTKNDTCLAVLQNKADKDLAECLKLLPAGMMNWERMNICEDNIKVFTKESK